MQDEPPTNSLKMPEPRDAKQRLSKIRSELGVTANIEGLEDFIPNSKAIVNIKRNLRRLGDRQFLLNARKNKPNKTGYKKLPKEKLRKLKKKARVVSLLKATTKALDEMNTIHDEIKGPIEDIFMVKKSKLQLKLDYQKLMRQKLIKSITNSVSKDKIKVKKKRISPSVSSRSPKPVLSRSMVDLTDPVKYDKDQTQI